MSFSVKQSIEAVALHLQFYHCPGIHPYLFSISEADSTSDMYKCPWCKSTPKPFQHEDRNCVPILTRDCVKKRASDARVGERPSQNNKCAARGRDWLSIFICQWGPQDSKKDLRNTLLTAGSTLFNENLQVDFAVKFRCCSRSTQPAQAPAVDTYFTSWLYKMLCIFKTYLFSLWKDNITCYTQCYMTTNNS